MFISSQIRVRSSKGKTIRVLGRTRTQIKLDDNLVIFANSSIAIKESGILFRTTVRKGALSKSIGYLLSLWKVPSAEVMKNNEMCRV